ncbi:13279_t:CDS:2, partial [Acaulospora colombiana]
IYERLSDQRSLAPLDRRLRKLGFLDRYQPNESDSAAVINSPKIPTESNKSYSLLRLSMDSLAVSMVQAVIKEMLYDQTDLEEAWSVIHTRELLQCYGNEHQDRRMAPLDLEKAQKDIQDVIMKAGNFTLPPPIIETRDPRSPSPSIGQPIDCNPVPPEVSRIDNTTRSSTRGEKRKRKKRNHEAKASTSIPSPSVVDEESKEATMGQHQTETSAQMQETTQEVRPSPSPEQPVTEVDHPATIPDTTEDTPIIE